MVAYGLEVFPLIKNLKAAYEVTQSWYAVDIGGLGKFRNKEDRFNYPTQSGTYCGYLPEPTRNILIFRPDNIEAVILFRKCCRSKVFTGAHYLRDFIGHEASKLEKMIFRTVVWEKTSVLS